jgi:hypothetical protein
LRSRGGVWLGTGCIIGNYLIGQSGAKGIYGEPTVRNYCNFDAMRALQKFVDAPSLWGSAI